MASSENLSPQVLSRVRREIAQLARSPPEGVRYVPTEDESLSEVHAELDGPEDTPFEGGTFRLKLVLKGGYPAGPPKGFFLTKIYHPNIASNGDICVNTLKRDWSQSHTLSHVLQVIRCLLIIPFPESSLNDEAGKFFMDSYDEYARRARIMTSVHAMKKSQSTSSSTSLPGAGPKKAEAEDNQEETPTGTLKAVSGSQSTKKNNSAASVKENVASTKQKVAKKKSLKRL